MKKRKISPDYNCEDITFRQIYCVNACLSAGYYVESYNFPRKIHKQILACKCPSSLVLVFHYFLHRDGVLVAEVHLKKKVFHLFKMLGPASAFRHHG
jgi:hypothetical protein